MNYCLGMLERQTAAAQGRKSSTSTAVALWGVRRTVSGPAAAGGVGRKFHRDRNSVP